MEFIIIIALTILLYPVIALIIFFHSVLRDDFKSHETKYITRISRLEARLYDLERYLNVYHYEESEHGFRKCKGTK